MRVLVCGGRGFGLVSPDITDPAARATRADSARAERNALKSKLFELKGRGMTLLIHGGARGADTLAGDWAEVNGVPQNVYWADWQRWGRAAGPLRNRLMLEDGQPDLVVAFPGGSGTRDMVSRSIQAGLPVEIMD